tara:strand:- start:21 stop:317 length:297 start_codon:yes stop_codon:yes gene_type:complete
MVRLIISYAFLLSLGFFGVHRFYLGRNYTGILYLCTGGVFGLGVILDFFLIPFMVAEDINSTGGSVLDFLVKILIGLIGLTVFSFMVTVMLALLLGIF